MMKWGQAKFEFLALREEIHKALASGKTAKRIHADLKSQNRIKMSQRSFYGWLRHERLFGPLMVAADIASMRTKRTQHHPLPQNTPSPLDNQEDEQ
ncbi:hypothetical protein J4E05_09265 [Thalassospira sp. NFXS8]